MTPSMDRCRVIFSLPPVGRRSLAEKDYEGIDLFVAMRLQAMPSAGRWKATHDNLRKELGVRHGDIWSFARQLNPDLFQCPLMSTVAVTQTERPDEGPLIPKGCGWSRFLSQRTQAHSGAQGLRQANCIASPRPLEDSGQCITGVPACMSLKLFVRS